MLSNDAPEGATVQVAAKALDIQKSTNTMPTLMMSDPLTVLMGTYWLSLTSGVGDQDDTLKYV